MAGAAIELTEAIIVNPNDVEQIEKAILQALIMPEQEQLKNLHLMQKKIAKQTVNKWASDFVEELQSIQSKNVVFNQKKIEGAIAEEIKSSYKKANKRLFILDYDGTLSPFKSKPEDAIPSIELLATLEKLCNNINNHVVISSGRDHETLDRWFGNLSLSLAAEHGAFYKQNGVWYENIHEILWDDEILNLLKLFVDKTPRSKIEIKKTALVWHFRNVDGWLASLREQQLINALITPCTRLNLQIMQGNKIVEIKSPHYSKGSEAKRILQNESYDFILAMGDDTTDEDTFRELPPEAFTIKVGSISDIARYCLCSQSEAIPFLKQLIN
jgi:trehalose 6-phosphate synthase/phosphatase